MKILCVGDAPVPFLTTGFANVTSQVWTGLHEAGLDVVAFGMMYEFPDYDHKVEYGFWPCNPHDELGHKTLPLIINSVKPDAMFIICDPGNLDLFMNIITGVQRLALDARGYDIKPFPVFSYTPIEGTPIPRFVRSAFEKIQRTGGVPICYSPGAAKAVKEAYKEVSPEWAYHGHDHAPFEKYDEEYRQHLKHIVGLGGEYVIGSVGVNKRTKGFDTLIYTASYMKHILNVKDVKFYLHTSALYSTMNGYNLLDMAEQYCVDDIVLFKPNKDVKPGGNIMGIERTTGDRYRWQDTEKPDTPEKRKDLFSQFSFVERLNVFDLYADASQVEGWGLPVFEAMSIGIPSITINDGSIRSEIHGDGAYLLSPGPDEYAQTWHTGVRLPSISYIDMAKAIMKIKSNEDLQKELSESGIRVASKYKWADTKKKISDIVLSGMEKFNERESKV